MHYVKTEQGMTDSIETLEPLLIKSVATGEKPSLIREMQLYLSSGENIN